MREQRNLLSQPGACSDTEGAAMMGEVVTCQKCGYEIGREFEIDGVLFLESDSLLIRRVDASCKNCGGEVHWVVSDIRLEKLIKRVLDGRSKYT